MDGRTSTMMKAYHVLLFWLLLGLNVSYADETLTQLMERMKTDSTVKMAYQETRTLELMDHPWQGSGYMYSIPPDLMIREQLQPQHLLMAVDGDKLFYFDPENDIRHQAEMDEDNPLSLNMAVFKALINADEALLHAIYWVEFTSNSQRWLMHLKPRQDRDSGFKITVSGLAGQLVDTIKIQQADGDLSEFALQKAVAGNELETTVKQLYQTLAGE